PPTRWPIDSIIATLRKDKPFVLEKSFLFLFALAHCTEAILGSSASNLYRTECLQQNPFRTDFGTVGDGAWGLQNALSVRFGITPLVCSTFRLHPKAYAASEYAVNDLTGKLFTLARETYLEKAARDVAFGAEAREFHFAELLRELERYLACQRRLEQCRRSRWPWGLNPAAWRSRAKRGQHAQAIEKLKAAAILNFERRARSGS
ncbi:MAG: hypothetical protein JWR69_879, partial [Pedosphaera sp.]|nr:hypothetical protein [Pedosphaera sp.]